MLDSSTSSRRFRLATTPHGSATDIVIARGLLDATGDHVRASAHEARRAFVVTTDTVAGLYADRVERSLAHASFAVTRAAVRDGESAKSLATAGALYESMLDARIDRGDVVVGLGGGVVTDLAGFVAATYKRGLAVVHCPTTVLAQVDAAIGGKTGVNLPRGKNLVGAFHQPVLVLADIDTLETLPAREFRAGLAEVVKCAMIADAQLFEGLERWGASLAPGGIDEHLLHAVAQAIGIKVGVVSRDEREDGERTHLNFGHTLGHAIEAATGYERYLHGEAVAIGMTFAAVLGENLGITKPGVAGRLTALLTALDLPTGAGGLRAGELLDKLQHDKKIKGDGRPFVLTPSIGSVSVAARVPDEAIAASLDAILR